MTTSRSMLAALKAFHLDNPEATFAELVGHLKAIAEDALAQPQDDAYGLVLSDLAEGLYEVEQGAALTLAQAKAVKLAYGVLRAHRDRIEGNVGPLIELLEGDLEAQIEPLYQSWDSDRFASLGLPICKRNVPSSPLKVDHQVAHAASLHAGSVPAPNDTATSPKAGAQASHEARIEPLSSQEDNPTGLTFMALYEAYMAERSEGMAPATIKNMASTAKTVDSLLQGVDMRSHTRADMVTLRGALLESRKPSTVNKLLTNVGALTAWGVATGLLTHDYARKLTITKGADSERQAFAPGQLRELTKAATTGYLKGDWKGHALALGLSTGARIGELHQVHGCDFIQGEDGQWSLSINDDNGKTLKNAYSRRVVPLVGIPEATIAALAAVPGRVFTQSMSGFAAQLNAAIRDTLGTGAGEGLSFHSLRHSLASDLKAQGVAVGISQEILGHSSGSITYDLYGKGAGVDLGRLREALELVR
ncbi:tyrosine-type recombinase/integrase [Pseudomonas soli]|uniref:tyrosine-type recombinase/integrase n=1 Tax=Pseudomonas soli TaxID=1306993 RepID=UPI00345D5E37